MKIFQRYNPLQVAKYVKILFRGRLYIKDVGAFEFDKGKILIPKVKDKLHLSVMSEVNRQVSRLQTEMAQPEKWYDYTVKRRLPQGAVDVSGPGISPRLVGIRRLECISMGNA